jgi:hypothetical protein
MKHENARQTHSKQYRMDRSDMPVVVRTSASARDFWCRIRPGERPAERSAGLPDERASTANDRALSNRQSFVDHIQRDLPFTRQIRPSPRPPGAGGGPSPVLPSVQTSRSIERKILQGEIHNAENQHPNPPLCNYDLAIENARLKKEREYLQLRYTRVLRINHALTGQMLHEVRGNK